MGAEIKFNRQASASYERRAARLLRGFYRRVAAEVAAAAEPGATLRDAGTGPGRLPLGPLTAALSRLGQLRRSALHPLSIYTRLETVPDRRPYPRHVLRHE